MTHDDIWNENYYRILYFSHVLFCNVYIFKYNFIIYNEYILINIHIINYIYLL